MRRCGGTALADQSLDWVFSSLALQWCERPAQAFAELNRVLKPGGQVFFSTLLSGSLWQLREAWRAVDGRDHVNRFLTLPQLQQAARDGGFEAPALCPLTWSLAYPALSGLLRDLKGIGASQVNDERSAGLGHRQRLVRLGRPTSATVNRTACWPPATRSASGAWCGADTKKTRRTHPSAAGRAPAFHHGYRGASAPCTASRNHHGDILFHHGHGHRRGQTLVARTLLLALAARGIRCAGYKPVSAGCTRTPEGLRNLDALLLQQAATVALPYEQVNPYAFEPPIAPISPPVSGGEHPLRGLSAGLREIEGAGADLVIVEGAGAGSCRWIISVCSEWVAQSGCR